MSLTDKMKYDDSKIKTQNEERTHVSHKYKHTCILRVIGCIDSYKSRYKILTTHKSTFVKSIHLKFKLISLIIIPNDNIIKL